MKFHALAGIFPLLGPEELQALAHDIAANGQKYPIISFKGEVLDGRNRLLACEQVKVQPWIESYEGDEPLGEIISLNLKRRHLNESQRAMAAARLATMPHGGDRRSDQAAHLPVEKIDQPTAAKLLNISERSLRTAKEILAHAPDQVAFIDSGEKNVTQVRREVQRAAVRKAEQAAARSGLEAAQQRLKSVCDLRHCAMAELLANTTGIDAIITDPPYFEQFLPLYGELARLAQDVPLVAVMTSQLHLPRILADMTKHLRYRWTLAYLTPGGQSSRIGAGVKVNNFWKPILLFGESAKWIGDVCKSEVNDNDKVHHHWGQSESGMADLVRRLTKPGQLICDPFLGGGTTSVVSVALGRRFVGCDTDQACVTETWQRLTIRHICARIPLPDKTVSSFST